MQFIRDKYMRVLVFNGFTRKNELISGLMRESGACTELYRCLCLEDAEKLIFEKEIDLFVIGLYTNRFDGEIQGLKLLRTIRKTEKYFDAYAIVISDLIDKELLVYKDYHCYKFYEYPFDKEEFKNDLKELSLKLGLSAAREKERRKDYVHIAIEDSFYKIEKDNIIMIELHSKYDIIYLKKIGEISLPKGKLKHLIGNLDISEMLPCNRSNIVNMRNVVMIDKKNNKLMLEEFDREISITELGKKNLRKYLEYWNMKS